MEFAEVTLEVHFLMDCIIVFFDVGKPKTSIFTIITLKNIFTWVWVMGYGLIALPWPFLLDRPIIPKEVSHSKYNVEQVITVIWTETIL